MNKAILTPKKAEEIQKEIFKKMPLEKKIKMIYDFFKFAKKVTKSNYHCDPRRLSKKDLEEIGEKYFITKKDLPKIKSYNYK